MTNNSPVDRLVVAEQELENARWSKVARAWATAWSAGGALIATGVTANLALNVIQAKVLHIPVEQVDVPTQVAAIALVTFAGVLRGIVSLGVPGWIRGSFYVAGLIVVCIAGAAASVPLSYTAPALILLAASAIGDVHFELYERFRKR